MQVLDLHGLSSKKKLQKQRKRSRKKVKTHVYCMYDVFKIKRNAITYVYFIMKLVIIRITGHWTTNYRHVRTAHHFMIANCIGVYSILLYSRTKGVHQKYLLYICCIGSVYTNINQQQCSICTISQLAH